MPHRRARWIAATLSLMFGCARPEEGAPVAPAPSPSALAPRPVPAPEIAVVPAVTASPRQAPVYPWLADPACRAPAVVDALEDRFAPPAGFARAPVSPRSFGAWLRRLPLAAPGTNEPSPPRPSPAPPLAHPAGPGRLPGRILLAEDDEANVDHLRDYLVSQGSEVFVAGEGATAVALARQLAPAVIVMDVQMPGMSGLEAIAVLRADPSTQRIPIIAVTALAMPGDRERCLAAGADDYLQKPLRLRELRERLVALQASDPRSA